MFPASPNSFRSCPAQKPLPAPVTTTARTSGSRASLRASRSAVCSARLNALHTSGRLSVIVCTAPSRVTSTSAIEKTLTPLEVGRALLDEGLESLAGVLRRAREVEGAAFERDAGRERRLECLVDRLLREPHGDRALRGDVARDALRLVEP